MRSTKLAKRRLNTEQVAKADPQLNLLLATFVPPDLDAAAPEAAQVSFTGNAGQLSLSKVLWKFDMRPDGAERAWPVKAALSVGVTATPHAPLSKALSTAKAAKVEYGFMGPELREYFLSGDAELTGILLMKRAGDKWKAGMAKGHLPYVLSEDAVAKGDMPPSGRSALPASLERVVPAKYAYWTVEDPKQAEAVRNALVDSALFEDRLIKVVDGDLRLCIEQLFLYEPSGEAAPAAKAEAPTLRTAIVDVMPLSVRKLAARSPLAEEGDWVDALTSADAACLVLSASSDAVFAEVIAKLSQPTTNPWLVEYDDTPASREAMWKIGRPFTLDTPDAAGHLFVASFDLVETPLLTWATRISSADDALRKRALRIAKTEKDGEDERYVLGIVLEPEVIDAQNDIYSQGEIRKTAHGFMEQYRTIGLMHKGSVNDKVKILESYIAPADFEVDGQLVKAGTWMLAVRVQDDELWKACKAGELSGFSIGGSAIRRPEGSAPSV